MAYKLTKVYKKFDTCHLDSMLKNIFLLHTKT